MGTRSKSVLGYVGKVYLAVSTTVRFIVGSIWKLFRFAISKGRLIKNSRVRQNRCKFEAELARLPRFGTRLIEGPVLLDASWDNPNFWLRVWLLIRSLGIEGKDLYGVIGPFNRSEQIATLKRFSGNGCEDLTIHDKNANEQYARELLSKTETEKDLLQWSLPEEVPVVWLYDYLLKRQRSPYVILEDPKLVMHITDFLGYIEAAMRIIEKRRPSIVFASHAISISSPLVWIALEQSIPVIVPYGSHGVLKYWRLDRSNQVFDFIDRLKPEEVRTLSSQKRQSLTEQGQSSLMERLSARSRDIAGLTAFQMKNQPISRQEICNRNGWRLEDPVVALYAGNWYDFPHTLGMRNFSNYYDFITQVCYVANRTGGINWLFKDHPLNKKLKQRSLYDDINLSNSPNLAFAHDKWRNYDVLEAVDAVVTVHGTVALEASCLGKPVLVADEGWLNDLGFVVTSKNRGEFLKKIETSWWRDVNVDSATKKALVVAGAYWGRPAWQENFLLADDHAQWEIYDIGRKLLRNNVDVIKIEMEMIRTWYLDGHSHYHTYKMLSADQYIH